MNALFEHAVDRGVAMMERRPLQVLFIAFLAYYITFFNYGIDLDDEGYLLLNASSILTGQWPMADFQSYQPFSYFLLAGFFKLVGDGVFTERLLLMVIILSNIGLLYFCASKLLSPLYAFSIAVLYGVAPGPWYKVFFIWHLIIFLASVIWAIDRPSLFRFFLVGLSSGLAISSRYQAGVIAIIVFFSVMAVYGYRLKADTDKKLVQLIKWSGSYLLGLTLIPAAFIVAYAQMEKLPSAVKNIQHYYNVTNLPVVIQSSGVSSTFDPLLLIKSPTMEMWAYAIALAACMASLIVFSKRVFFFKEHNKRDLMALTAALVGLGSMAYTYNFVWNSRMLSSFAVVYINFFLVLGLLREKMTPQLGRVYGVNSRGLYLLAFCMLSAYLISFVRVQNYSGSITTRMSAMVKVDHPKLQGIYVYADQKPDIDALMNYAQLAAPGDALISMSESTTMSYLSGLPNPTYYRLFLAEFAPDGEQEKAIRTFDQLNIRYFVARKGQFIPGGGPSSDITRYAPQVFEYLKKNYDIKPLGKRFILLERKSIKS